MAEITTVAEIIAFRKRLRLTQEQFAAKIGVTVSQVNRWENGHNLPSPLAFMAINKLKIEVDANA